MSVDGCDEKIVGVLARVDVALARVERDAPRYLKPPEFAGWAGAIAKAREELAKIRRDFEPEGWRRGRR